MPQMNKGGKFIFGKSLIQKNGMLHFPEQAIQEYDITVEGCYIPAEWRRDIDQRYLEHIKFICLAMSEEYIEDHFDAIIVHESEVENRLIKADCTADDLKQCNRWFIDLFSSVGEKVVIIEDDFDKTLAKLLD